MSFNDNNDTINNFNNNTNSMNNNSLNNNLNGLNQYNDSSIGDASYEQPDYNDFESNETGKSFYANNGLKKKIIIAVIVIIVVIFLVLLFFILFVKGNKKLDLSVPDVVYAGNEVEFVAAIPSSNKELFYKFSSDDEEILQFEYNSLVSGDTANTMIPKKDGKVKIKVQAYDNGKLVGTYENEIVICPDFNENIFSSSDYKVGTGDDLSLNVDLGVYDECYQNLKYTSSNEEVATVSSDGVVSAKKKGDTTIKVSNGYKTVTKKVKTVSSSSVNSVAGVKLNTTSLSITVGSTASLSAIISPENATNKSVTWSSSNEDVALVSGKGRVLGIRQGSAVITVTTQDGNKTAMATVTVKKARTNSNSSNTSSSSNSSNSKSTSSSSNKTSTNKDIKVSNININSDDLNIKIGNTKVLSYTITPNNATNKKVIWDTTDPSVAKVNTVGKVTGVGVGTTYITLKSTDGVSDKIKVVVTKSDSVKATSITLNPTSLNLNVGNRKTLTATVLPSNATNKKVTWVSHNTNIAKVDSNGNVTAVSAGTTKISCYTIDGSASSSINITVKSTSSSTSTGGSSSSSSTSSGGSSSSSSTSSGGTSSSSGTSTSGSTTPSIPTTIKVSDLIVSPTKMNIMVGNTKNIDVTVLPDDATNTDLIWTSSNSNIVTVKGKVGHASVKGVSDGTATITVRSVSTPSVSKTITVNVSSKNLKCNIGVDANDKELTGTALLNIKSSRIIIDAICKATNTTINSLTVNTDTKSLKSVLKLGVGSANVTFQGEIANKTGSNNGSHKITVTAIDGDGQKYTFTKDIKITGNDSVPPYISADGGLTSKAKSGQMTLSATAVDEDSGIASVTFHYTNNSTKKSYSKTITVSNAPNSYDASITFNTSKADVSYNYYVVVKDKAGYSYTSKEVTSVKSK